MDKIDLVLKTGRITANNIRIYSSNGYVPIFVCRFMNPLVKVYEDTVLHFPELAPSASLLYNYKNEVVEWDEYKRRYLEEISKVNLVDSMNKIYDLVKMNPEVNAKGAVLLCYCRDYTKCHRSILADVINSADLLTEPVTELYV